MHKLMMIGFLLLLSPFSIAATNPLIDFSPVVNAVFGVQESVGGVNHSVADLNQQVVGLPNVLTHFLVQAIKQSIGSFSLSLVLTFKTFLVHPVEVSRFAESWKWVVTILSTGYILFLSFFGIKMLQAGSNPIEREKAKSNMGKIVIMILLTGLSLEMYELVLSINYALSSAIWSSVLDSFFSYENLSTVNFFMLVYFSSSLLTAFTTVFLRYLIIMAGILLLPLAICLYFFEPLQAYGRLLIQVIGVAIFIPFVDSLILWGVSLAVQEAGTNSVVDLLFPSAGFLLVGIANAGLLFFAVLHSAFKNSDGK